MGERRRISVSPETYRLFKVWKITRQFPSNDEALRFLLRVGLGGEETTRAPIDLESTRAMTEQEPPSSPYEPDPNVQAPELETEQGGFRSIFQRWVRTRR